MALQLEDYALIGDTRSVGLVGYDGSIEDGRVVFERLLGHRNDLGLLSEEYDVGTGRLVGNFPQALSHLALVNTALELASGGAVPRRTPGARPGG